MPMLVPPASAAPRLAASMMPGPPPEHSTKRRAFSPRLLDHWVSRKARSCAALQCGESCFRRAEPKNTMVSEMPAASRRLFGSRYSARMRSARASLLLMNFGSRYALTDLATTLERHFCCFDCQEEHVGLDRKVRHVEHCLPHMRHVHERLGLDRAVGLRHAIGHARRHLSERVADVHLADRDVVLAAVECAGLGEAGDAVLGRRVSHRARPRRVRRDRAVIDDAAAARSLVLHHLEGLL